MSVHTDEAARVLTDTEPLEVAVEGSATEGGALLSKALPSIVNGEAPQRKVTLARLLHW